MMKRLPDTIELRAICEKWIIQYQNIQQTRVTTTQLAPYHLTIKGPFTPSHCFTTLEKWLKRKAKRHFGKWLQALSEDTELHFKAFTIRGQNGRWGSCSQHKEINLNYKLLFLPARLVEHILLHELCHTKELNHSKQFWTLLASFDTHYKKHRKLLRESHHYLPKWV